MNIKPIKTEEDYKLALARANELMDAEMDTPQGDELDILATLIEHYEAKHYAIAPPNPIEAIQFRMEQMGLERQDLEIGRSPKFILDGYERIEKITQI